MSLKTFSKRGTQRTTEAIAGLNGNKIAEKINKILNRFVARHSQYPIEKDSIEKNQNKDIYLQKKDRKLFMRLI